MALSKIDVANMLTGATPVANGGTALTSGFVNGGGVTVADTWRVNPNKTPIHCFIDTFSFKMGPLNAFVRTG